MTLKPGDLITINGKEDARRTLQLLGNNGLGAVVTDMSYRYIRITSVPDDPEGGNHGRS